MNLHKQIMVEETIPTTSAEDLWAQNSGDVGQYITTKIFQVLPITNKNITKYTVYLDSENKRTLIGNMNQTKLDKSYTPVRPNQKPDAEGFTTYREIAEYEAFKYMGDTTKVTISDKTTVKLNKGDYILRQTAADNFVYSIELARYFDQYYTKKI